MGWGTLFLTAVAFSEIVLVMRWVGLHVMAFQGLPAPWEGLKENQQTAGNIYVQPSTY